jgi:hypothetical protein
MSNDAFDPRTPLSPIGDEVIFENEYVRVWGLALDPGGRQPWRYRNLLVEIKVAASPNAGG